MIAELKNPLTGKYYELKNLVLGERFPWYASNNGLDSFNYYSHVFLERPDHIPVVKRYPVVSSPYIDLLDDVLEEIFLHNSISPSCIYRMNANATDPGYKQSTWHKDHEFPHHNLLIYLTDAGGITKVEDKQYDPKEDDIITFQGEHCHMLPKEKRRVVLVVTYA
jgi:hypothetical protein|tara:strand:+ start:3129 stop:3623 length:495 start_codon:yes stop_codon:yes gene_type:complete